ncbi:DNA gyrase subunit A [Mesomycoplasma hyopneumoniae]|uniref:DNA topoisomerase (ATP-hydrolyzing) n=2 Tax=Mesomycoplasma hyopneumoniae (strain 168) TaxID=907287 RepID=E4QTI7_MESH1|nr:DNA gyrase subunit A [Mesomycoplasma hyopneumoniae]ADQ90734.1 DNA gyrase subunit A [Mesomycoplasma hyopneumoniae 168]AGM22310.1 DNA gyrase subunit A [Mesomycoplasma hyopneumoniae 168-L]OWY74025.1 DNA gyrase subunit A [Mesomycoplasma hyopneumoniae]
MLEEKDKDKSNFDNSEFDIESNDEIDDEDTNYKVKPTILESITDNISPIKIEDEMKASFLDYSMSVIVSRALPDVRDGLKPVHRRILYTMAELGITSGTSYKKSARIVGDVLGKYHPHGDASVYESMVRMAQPFSLRYPLVDGHGNFGSIDGDEAAAMRYTEARLSKISNKMIEGLKKNTVDFRPNYDASEVEPEVLPAKFPNLLVSGVSGIAVGMMTKIPPHNLGEIIHSFIIFAKNPKIEINELISSLPGPDFPTGATIYGKKGINQAYLTGKGSFIIRAKAKIENLNSGRSRIIFYEIPYEVKKPAIIEKVAFLVRNKKILGIKDVRDESSRHGIRVVFEIKKGFSPEIILNKLYHSTDLQINYSINMLALVNGVPKLMNLAQIFNYYLEHQKEINLRSLNFDLEKATEKLNVLEGIKVAVENIDEVIKIIKSSKSDQAAQEKLAHTYNLNSGQTKAIIEMRLGRLTSLAIEKLNNEIEELKVEISEIKSIIDSPKKLIDLIIEQHKNVVAQFGDPRRSEIIPEIDCLDEEDLIADEQVIISLTQNNYVKKMVLDEYRLQNRGGIGTLASNHYKDDELKSLCITNTLSDLLIISSSAKIFKLRAHQIPDGSKQGKGIPILNLIKLEKNESISNLIPWNQEYDNHWLITVSAFGNIKKTALSAFRNITKNGKIGLKLVENDYLVSAFIAPNNPDLNILIGSSQGFVNRWSIKLLRDSGRTAIGVKGIKLEEGHKIIGACFAFDNNFIFSLSKKGFGKKTQVGEYRLTGRTTKGLMSLDAKKAGNLVFISAIKNNQEAIITTKKGFAIRIDLDMVPIISRRTKGVKIITLKKGDEITAVSLISKNETEKQNE